MQLGTSRSDEEEAGSPLEHPVKRQGQKSEIFVTYETKHPTMCAFTIDDPCFQFLPSLFCLLPSPPRAFPECVDFLSATHIIPHPTCVSHKFAEYKGVFTILKWVR